MSESKSTEIEVELLDEEKWKRLHETDNEILVGVVGRSLIPGLHYKIKNLTPSKKYTVGLKMRLCNLKPYRYHVSTGWKEDYRAENVTEIESEEIFLETSTSGRAWSGEELMKRGIDFQGAKVFNKLARSDKEQTAPEKEQMAMKVFPNCKYIPILTIYESTPWGDFFISTFQFEETKFIAVTEYKNSNIATVKSISNQFVRGNVQKEASAEVMDHLEVEEPKDDSCQGPSIVSLAKPPTSDAFLEPQPEMQPDIEVELLDRDTWKRLDALQGGNEMAIRVCGRSLFPRLQFKIKNLEPLKKYTVGLKMRLCDLKPYRYHVNWGWKKDYSVEDVTEMESNEIFLKPRDPKNDWSGGDLMKYGIDFGLAKIYNKATKSGKEKTTPEKVDKKLAMRVLTNNKYIPILTIYESTSWGDFFIRAFQFDETKFITVTEYKEARYISSKSGRISGGLLATLPTDEYCNNFKRTVVLSSYILLPVKDIKNLSTGSEIYGLKVGGLENPDISTVKTISNKFVRYSVKKEAIDALKKFGMLKNNAEQTSDDSYHESSKRARVSPLEEATSSFSSESFESTSSGVSHNHQNGYNNYVMSPYAFSPVGFSNFWNCPNFENPNFSYQ
ncbi:Protein CBG00340 [Caenorhabditis briggsae]|uniref:Protein CBG00340 n=1 Tax=Caenorhabditis briggsae TaxID=6238 RepID=A8WMV3_CAEBR|nr:Protein CBG00340 [Caenorhabditis briggsae]CAP21808.2 Protein CBG00340 [Caenorhabditis briggsae]